MYVREYRSCIWPGIGRNGIARGMGIFFFWSGIFSSLVFVMAYLQLEKIAMI
jgi:hypothetical protein